MWQSQCIAIVLLECQCYGTYLISISINVTEKILIQKDYFYNFMAIINIIIKYY